MKNLFLLLILIFSISNGMSQTPASDSDPILPNDRDEYMRLLNSEYGNMSETQLWAEFLLKVSILNGMDYSQSYAEAWGRDELAYDGQLFITIPSTIGLYWLISLGTNASLSIVNSIAPKKLMSMGVLKDNLEDTYKLRKEIAYLKETLGMKSIVTDRDEVMDKRVYSVLNRRAARKYMRPESEEYRKSYIRELLGRDVEVEPQVTDEVVEEAQVVQSDENVKPTDEKVKPTDENVKTADENVKTKVKTPNETKNEIKTRFKKYAQKEAQVIKNATQKGSTFVPIIEETFEDSKGRVTIPAGEVPDTDLGDFFKNQRGSVSLFGKKRVQNETQDSSIKGSKIILSAEEKDKLDVILKQKQIQYSDLYDKVNSQLRTRTSLTKKGIRGLRRLVNLGGYIAIPGLALISVALVTGDAVLVAMGGDRESLDQNRDSMCFETSLIAQQLGLFDGIFVNCDVFRFLDNLDLNPLR